MSRISPPSHEQLNLLFSEACEDYRHGRLESAGAAFRELIAYCGDAPILHYNLGLVHFQQEEFGAARDAFARAAERAPEDDDILFNLALSEKKCGNPEAAITAFSRLLQHDPNNIDALYNLAGSYRDNLQHREAKDTYRQVLRLAPDHLPANNNLAYLHHLDGEFDLALACYRKVLEENPQHQAAAHMVAALTGENASGSPDAYVRDVFDSYAQHFEKSLVEELGYCVPGLLRDFHDRTVGGARRYARGLDLGCGTGLGGAAFAELIEALDGLDLSAKMLAIAAEKNIYLHLHQGSIAEILTARKDTFDFYLAADVFNYVGDLETTFRLLRERARPDAVCCFSTETAAAGNYRLQQTGRFAHCPDYVRQLARATGWQVAAAESARLRKEQGEWVEGQLWLFRPVKLLCSSVSPYSSPIRRTPRTLE